MHSRRLQTSLNGKIGRTPWIAVLCIVGSTHSVLAQPLEQVTQPPTLIFVLSQVFGPDGLFVDSGTHRAHFNASFEAGFAPINLALARQLATSFVPTPVSAGGYALGADGLFHLSPQGFGVMFSERSELIGSGEIAFGFSMHHAD